jgi:hypothetical protein
MPHKMRLKEMMMTKKYVRPFTPAWRWFIALSSVGAFVGGWTVLAHTPNPYDTAAASADLPVLQTQPNTNQIPQQTLPQNNARPFQSLPSQGTGRSRNTLPQNTQPQFQPNTQSQLPTTRVGRQPRLRSGGS